MEIPAETLWKIGLLVAVAVLGLAGNTLRNTLLKKDKGECSEQRAECKAGMQDQLHRIEKEGLAVSKDMEMLALKFDITPHERPSNGNTEG